MFRKLDLAVAAVLGVGIALPASADIRVFACEPEWAALAREVGGARIEAFSATHARQDPHHIRARPSLIASMRRSDLLFCSGGGLEVGWLPILLQQGASANLQPGRRGNLMAAEHVAVLEKPADIDGANAAAYRKQAEDFAREWARSLAAWEERAKKLKGMPVIAHHKSWAYLFQWLGLKEVATLEPRPGIQPTPGHLADLLRLSRAQPVKAILRTPYDSPEASDWLSARTGIPVLTLPYTVGVDAGPGALRTLFDETISRLEGAHSRSNAER